MIQEQLAHLPEFLPDYRPFPPVKEHTAWQGLPLRAKQRFLQAGEAALQTPIAPLPLSLWLDFTFVGGHPMAGTQYSGFANSRADLFQGAPMVIVPKERDDILLLDRVKKLLTPAGFSHMTVTTAEHHDAMIAYTSQMCHVLSNAYVKSPRAQMHKGYSAGSYRDLTRVAWLNETMWTDLFLENRDYLLEELDRLIGYLGEYREALEQGNGDRLCTLLAEGRICKEKVDAE